MSETKQPVPPISGHYALLRGGAVKYLARGFTSDWESDGKSKSDYDLDIIATISPADMQAVASGELERLRAALQNIRALAAKRQHEGGPDGNSKTIEEFAIYGLEGKNP